MCLFVNPDNEQILNICEILLKTTQGLRKRTNMGEDPQQARVFSLAISNWLIFEIS